jgi:glutamate-1-semialdehyde 2,1-aminomutase
LEETTAAIAEGVVSLAKEAGVPITMNRVGSMWTWFFTGQAVNDFADASKSDTAAFARFHRAMMESGVWLPPSQFEAAFLGTAHGQAEVDFLLDAAHGALRS